MLYFVYGGAFRFALCLRGDSVQILVFIVAFATTNWQKGVRDFRTFLHFFARFGPQTEIAPTAFVLIFAGMRPFAGIMTQ